METKRYPLTEEIDGVDGYVEISKGRQKFVMEDGKKVAPSAFISYGMDEIFFPDSLEEIGNTSFIHCWRLKTIHFGRNIIRIVLQFCAIRVIYVLPKKKGGYIL